MQPPFGVGNVTSNVPNLAPPLGHVKSELPHPILACALDRPSVTVSDRMLVA
jgi:hypothetical protein